MRKMIQLELVIDSLTPDTNCKGTHDIHEK